MKNAKMFILGLLVGILLVSATGAKVSKKQQKAIEERAKVAAMIYLNALKHRMEYSDRELQARQLLELERIGNALTPDSYNF
jgi:hypothetical protein